MTPYYFIPFHCLPLWLVRLGNFLWSHPFLIRRSISTTSMAPPNQELLIAVASCSFINHYRQSLPTVCNHFLSSRLLHSCVPCPFRAPLPVRAFLTYTLTFLPHIHTYLPSSHTHSPSFHTYTLTFLPHIHIHLPSSQHTHLPSSHTHSPSFLTYTLTFLPHIHTYLLSSLPSPLFLCPSNLPLFPSLPMPSLRHKATL